MNPNRESELRRKLEMTEVPPPPHGLADRIKGAIPEDAFPPSGVKHPSRSRFFPLQVAASVLLLSGAAYMATRVLLTGDPVAVRSAAYESKPAPVVTTANEMSSSAPTVAADAQPQEQDEGATQSRLQPAASTRNAPTIVADATARRAHDVPASPRADDARDSLSARDNATGFTSVEEVAVVAEAPAVTVAEARTSAEPPALAPPPPPPAAAPAPARVAVAQAAADSAAATMAGAVRERSAKARLEVAAPLRASEREAEQSVFGISVDESSVARVRATLDRGERPAAATVNPEAFVSYFANPQARPANNVSLEAEGSATPASTSASTVLLRFSVDTATANLTGRPAARDAKIDVELNPRVIARHRRIGGESKLSAAEPLLLRDVSVTAIYELELLPLAAGPQKAVTIKLRYRDPDSGREKMISRVLHVRDFSRKWEQASRRHRLATLGGMLSESLRGTPTGVDLARRAEDLAKEAPRDERARELSNAATASSRLRSSSPTGSGR